MLSIDIDPAVSAAIEPNARALGLENVTALCADSTRWLQNQTRRFDVVFIDPARRGADGSRLYSLADCHPDVTALLDDIERIAPRLIIKASPMLDITRTIALLRNIHAVYAVGTKSECKELLIDIRFGSNNPPRIFAATIGSPTVEITPAIPDLATDLSPGDIIGEPWPTVMKLQPSALSGQRLHPSTLLFRNPDRDFPGALYRLERIEEFSSSVMRRLAREKIQASVATRNFPLSAEALRNKLKTRESSALRLLATTLSPARRLLLFLSPL